MKKPCAFLVRAVLSGSLIIGGMIGLAPLWTVTPVSAAVTADSPASFCSQHDLQMTQRNWYFHTAGLDFGPNADAATPTVIDNRASTAGVGNEGATVVNDINGNLLFWTDGNIVWNRNQQVMFNGTNLGGNPSADQSTVAFPAITNPNRFFIISNASAKDGSLRNQLVWSMVDMTLDNGMGGVTADQHAILLGEGTYTDEALIAIPNSAGNGFWVVAHSVDGNMVAWEFDENGPKSQTPVVSNADTGLANSNRSRWASLSLSPDMSQLAYIDNGDTAASAWPSPTEYHGRVILFDVNATNGTMTMTANWTIGNGLVGGYSLAWSPSGQYLYASSLTSGFDAYWPYALVRYDVSSGDAATIKATESNVLPNQPADVTYYYWVGTLALAPNGKIYVAGGTADNTKATYGQLHVIETPDAADPGFQFNGLALAAGSNAYLALPQFATGCIYTPPAIIDDDSVHIVTFDPKGGTTVPVQTVLDGDEADEPIPPTFPGYNFDHWYICTDSTQARYNFTTPVTADLALCAMWDPPAPGNDPYVPPEDPIVPPGDELTEIPEVPGTGLDRQERLVTTGVPSLMLGAAVAGGVATIIALVVKRRR